MKKSAFAELIAEIASRTAPATAVATSLVAPLAQAASGDLDPSFGDHGRLGPIAGLEGPARSIEPLESGGAIFSGGHVERNCGWWYCYYDTEYETTNFVDALTADGAIDAAYEAAQVTSVEVLGMTRQADAKVVAVGRRVSVRRADVNNLVVFRLETDGPLDTTFGTGGIFELDTVAFGARNKADAVLVDPDGRILVTGARDDALIVLRLNPDGSLDTAFGDGGLFTGPAHSYDAGSRLARVSSGGYRVMTSDGTSCRIVGLTAGGTVDASYGNAGFATVAAAQGAAACHAIALQADDRLLVSGIASGQAFAERLLASGAPDPSFNAAEVRLAVSDATAIAVAPDGKILVGGDGLLGATVMRLQVTGELDALFGNAGQTTIDLRSDSGAWPRIHDIAVQPDGSMLVAGGDYATVPPRPYAARLLGDDGADSSGVLGIAPGDFTGIEAQDLAVTVRRTGGMSGAVSVAYQTVSNDGYAVAGEDYEQVSGTLYWADGEGGEKTIVLPILADTGEAEEYESFRLALGEPSGGAGLGTRHADVSIRPDGAPAGQISLEYYSGVVGEFGNAELWLYRNYYSEGEVCVALDIDSGTATAGEDFRAESSTQCWGDQDQEPKYIAIEIVDDTVREPNESFTVALSNPTGGAVIGPRGDATITIAANDRPVRVQRGGGGGGSTGFLAVILLGLAGILRAVRRRFPIPG
jgi:uncharacterized delta-60 repeat protein